MAAESALFFRWNRPVPGREAEATEVFEGLLVTLGQLQEAGLIESFEPMLFAAHAGDLNGAVVVRGDRQGLDDFRRSPDLLAFIFRAQYVLTGFGIINAYVGDGVSMLLSSYKDLLGD